MFLRSNSKNDLLLKVFFIKSLSIHKRKKILDLEEFFNKLTWSNNNHLVSSKKIILQLLKELSKNKIIQNEVEILFKSGRTKNMLITDLTISDITRRIKHINLCEILKILD